MIQIKIMKINYWYNNYRNRKDIGKYSDYLYYFLPQIVAEVIA